MAKKPYVAQKQLNRAMYQIGMRGVKGMTRAELKQLGLPIIREARKRVRALEAAGMVDGPAYTKYINELGMKMTTSGKDTNRIKREVSEAFKFLNAKTSTVEGARQYNKWLDVHLGATTTERERTTIWKIVHQFEETHPGRFINYGYDESIKKIADITKALGYERAEYAIPAEAELPMADRALTRKIGNYLSYQGELSIERLREYLDSESERIEADELFGHELEEESRSGWMKNRKRGSTTDF